MQNHRCPRVRDDARWLRSKSSGLWLPPACRAWFCEICGPRNAVRLGRALDAYGYDRTCTFTLAPRDLLQAARRLRHRLARKGPWEWAWSCELAPQHGMRHVHAVIRGQYWDAKGPENEMYDECKLAGWGHPAPRQHGWGGLYAAKNAVYATKERKIDYAAWRVLNGGVRPWHISRNFTGGLPLRDFTRKYAPSTDQGPWELVNASMVPPVVRSEFKVQRVAARRVYARVERRVLEIAVDDAAEETLVRRLGGVETDASVNAREGRPDRRTYPNAFSGMPVKPWQSAT